MLRLVDLGLLAILFVAPLFMGGRHPLGKLVFVAIVCATALVWTIGQCAGRAQRWIPTGGGLLLFGGLAIVMVQLLPLPHSWLSSLSPSLAEVLPAWSPGGVAASRWGTWAQVSLTPPATRIGLVMYLAYAMLFLLAIQRIRRLEDVERWLRWIAAAAVFMAAIGLLQFFGGNGRFLWVYDHPFRTTGDAVKGPFVNQNHFAHYLALGIGPLIWWTYRVWSERRKTRQAGFARTAASREWEHLRRPAAVGSLCIVILAALLSLSRGGVAAVFVAAIACMGVYASASLFRWRSVLTVAMVGCVVAAGVFIYGHEALTRELRTIADAESMDQLCHSRKDLWEADLRAVADFPMLGSGVGSHREVYPRYLQQSHSVTFTHAENGYLQVLMETGAAGLALLLTGIGLCGWWCVQTYRQTRSARANACLGAIVGALTASVLHSFVDFVWYIPACMSLTVILAACACRLRQLTTTQTEKAPETAPPPRVVWIAATVAVAGLGPLMVRTLVGPAAAAPFADDYRVIARKGESVFEDAPERIAQCVTHLERLLERNPDDARAHLQMASLLLLRFELEQKASDTPMPLIQIRGAAQTGKFASREQLKNWLSAATGDRCEYLRQVLARSQRSVQLCPMLGEGYTCMAEVAFLEGSKQDASDAYIEQAIRVRPYSAAVNFAAGRQAAMDGDLDGVVQHFRTAFDQSPYHRSRIIELLGHQGADFFFHHFKPDLSAIGLLADYYDGLGRADDLRSVRHRHVKMLVEEAQAKDGEEAADLWLRVQQVCHDLGDPNRAIQSAANAVQAAPNHYKSRRNLATTLIETQHYNEAIQHLQWCLLRYPENEDLQKDLALAQQHLRTASDSL